VDFIKFSLFFDDKIFAAESFRFLEFPLLPFLSIAYLLSNIDDSTFSTVENTTVPAFCQEDYFATNVPVNTCGN